MLEQARQAEINKYVSCYRSQNYRLGDRRRRHIEVALLATKTGSLLDVGCGRGEVLNIAKNFGFEPVQGVEAVPYLCDGVRVVNGLAHALPFADKSFDVVTMFDVMEHLLPEDTTAVCKELERVAKREILLTIHNGPSSFGDGVELHINRKESYEAWFDYLKATFAGEVTWLPRHGSISEMFKVSYGSR